MPRWRAAVVALALFWAIAAGLGPAAIAQEGSSVEEAPSAAEEGAPSTPQGMPAPTPVSRSFGLPPTVSMIAVPGYGTAPLTVGFFVDAFDPEDVDFVAYHWNFGDGNVSTLPPMAFFETYNQPGTYLVRLVAVTADGRSGTAFAGIVVEPSGIQ